MTTYASERRDGAGIPAILGELRELTEPAIRDAVSNLNPELVRVESYHRGWSTIDGQPSNRATGKALRSALAVLSARTVRGPDHLAAAAAAAVELVHDFSLLHDDVMDGDTHRRHQPTAWVVFGAGAAIVSGDALLALAIEVVLESGSPRTLDAVRLLNGSVRELIEGQAMDLEFEHRRDVTLAECERMAAGKTAALLECASSLGALLCGASDAEVACLRRFGRELGMAFQLVDDALGIWGDSHATGKPVLSDLRARKKTLPITVALRSDAAGLTDFRALMATDASETVPEEIFESAARELRDAGYHDWVINEAQRRLQLAENLLDSLDAPQTVKADLVELARFVVTRDL
jgi:geranylgeranyl diphosphate synthase type I